MVSPDDPLPDDSVCAQCNAQLPDNPPEESWGFQGYCGPACCLLSILYTARSNKGISEALFHLGRSAVREMKEAARKGDTMDRLCKIILAAYTDDQKAARQSRTVPDHDPDDPE